MSVRHVFEKQISNNTPSTSINTRTYIQFYNSIKKFQAVVLQVSTGSYDLSLI